MEIRTCKCCAVPKQLDAFHSHTVKGKRYWKHTCKECCKGPARERKRRWYYSNPARAQEDSRRWYCENRERAAGTNAAYKLANIEWWKAYHREYARKRRALTGA